MTDEERTPTPRRARLAAGVLLAVAVLAGCGQKGVVGDESVVPDPHNPGTAPAGRPLNPAAVEVTTTTTTAPRPTTTSTSTTTTSTTAPGGSTTTTAPGAGGTTNAPTTSTSANPPPQ